MIIFLSITTGILLFLTVCGTLQKIWWFSILEFFRLQYLIIATLFFVIAIITGHYFIAAILVFLVGYNLYRIRHFLPRLQSSDKETTLHRKILSINAHNKNTAPEKLKLLIKQTTPDLLLIMEMTDSLEDALQDVLSAYPSRLECDVRDGFRITLLGKNEFREGKITYHGPGDTPLLHAKTDIDDKEYQIYSAHPKPALNKGWSQERTIYFSEIKDVISREHDRTIMMGDFNTVPWEPWFLDFLQHTKLKSTLKDHGYRITWPTKISYVGIPMDHILVSKGVEYRQLKIGPYVGSDHFPISINL